MYLDDEVEMFDDCMTKFLYTKDSKCRWRNLDIASMES